MSKSKMHKTATDKGGNLSVALYIRVSTDRQAEEGYSVEIQKERLIAYTKTMDGIVSYKLYVDDGFSGASLQRPAMEKLIKNAKEKKLTHICVYKLDRLSRSQKDTLFSYRRCFSSKQYCFYLHSGEF